MSKLINKRISCCGECPYYRIDWNDGSIKYCYKLDKDIDDKYIIPSWCPLEDYKD